MRANYVNMCYVNAKYANRIFDKHFYEEFIQSIQTTLEKTNLLQ